MIVEKRVPTSGKVSSLIKVSKVYFGTIEKSSVILWTGSGMTLGGVATVYVTDNGLATGDPIRKIVLPPIFTFLSLSYE